MTQPPHAHVFPASGALATLKAKLRQLEAGSELQPCSWLPPTPFIVSALDPSQAGGEERHPHGREQGGCSPVPCSILCCFEEAHL